MTKTHTTGGLTEKHHRLIELLISGSSVTDAAAESGFSRAWAQHLMSDNVFFIAELERRRHESLMELRDRLRETVLTAASASMELLRDETVSPATRLQCACSILGKLERYFGEAKPPRTPEDVAGDMSRLRQAEIFRSLGDDEREKTGFVERSKTELDKEE